MLEALAKTWIHEEPGFFVLDKPAGIGMHDDSGVPGIVTLMRQYLQDSDIFPCHRLDKDTSGLLLLAKGRKSTQAISGLFAERKIQKYYVAISAAKPKKKQGSIIGDMQPAREGNWKLLKTRKKPAVTQFFSYGLGGLRGFVLKPATGKTHQIRVALKSISSPVLGDLRYGGAQPEMMEKYKKVINNQVQASDEKQASDKNGTTLSHKISAHTASEQKLYCGLNGIDRMYLHALSVIFELDDIQYRFTRKPEFGCAFSTSEFSSMLATIGEPENLPWPVVGSIAN